MTEYRLIGIILVDSGMTKIELENVRTCDITTYHFDRIDNITELEFLSVYTIEPEYKVDFQAELETRIKTALKNLPKGTQIKSPLNSTYYLTNVETGVVHTATIEKIVKMTK
jgi:hypothetical protein